MATKQTLETYAIRIRDLVLQFADIRLAGQVVFVVIVLLVSWSGIKAIETNYTLQTQVAQLEQQNEVQQLENSNVSLQNEYYQSKQYLELSARQNFGLGEPGEKELIVPQAVALSYVVSVPSPSPTPVKVDKLPAWEQNLKDWFDFFMHRSD